jgi:hypothetical protein
MAEDIYLVQLTAHDPTLRSATTLRFATGLGYVSAPTDLPPNVYWEPRVIAPIDVKRDIFTSGRTSGRSRMSFGDLVLNNADGQLDYLLTHGFSGRLVRIMHRAG